MRRVEDREVAGRLPWPVAACIILALSLVGWASLFCMVGFGVGHSLGISAAVSRFVSADFTVAMAPRDNGPRQRHSYRLAQILRALSADNEIL